MPMRSELAIPRLAFKVSSTPDETGVWAVISFCIIGAAIAICFAASSEPLDQMPLLIIQSNQW